MWRRRNSLFDTASKSVSSLVLHVSSPICTAPTGRCWGPPICALHILLKASSSTHPPQGYLFDRRQIGRLIQAEWGVPVEDSCLTTCVRRFATKVKPSPYDYVTAARVSSSNGHEVRMFHCVIASVYHNGSSGHPL